MPQQNLVAGTLTDANKQAVLTAIDTIRQKLPFLVNLSDDERRSLPKMGDKSTAFVQKAYDFAQQNTDKLGADFGMDDYTEDRELETQMREIETALGQVSEEVSDTMLALRSDLMVRSNLVYAFMKVLGKASGAFDEMRKDMGLRFKGQGQKTKPAGAGGTPSQSTQP
ncbi:MAG: hypothetical protein M3Y86_07230 [Verrucomicrobiota bacterium]|nr:hypothetical protein [Verrucomicrobiota bacterium]